MFVNQTQVIEEVFIAQKFHDLQPKFIWYIDFGITLILKIIFILFKQQLR